MAVPERITPRRLGDYLEILSRAVFQAGLSWALIETMWPDFKRVFHDFDPEWVASLSPAQIDRIADEPTIVRSRKKIEGTVHNAQTMLALDREYGGFQNYLRSFGEYDALRADIRKRFKFVGDLSVYYFLFRVGEPVPPFADWAKSVEGVHPRVREMLALGGDVTAQRELEQSGKRAGPRKKARAARRK